MKRVLLLFIIFTVTLLAEVSWNSYDGIYKKATQENKLVMVMITQEECDACWFMHKIVFKDKIISEEIAKNFVSVEFNVSEDFAPDEFPYFATPTFYFLNAKGEQIDRINGAFNVKDFTTIIERTIKKGVATPQ
jgi:thioredoxin-related protein